MSDSDAPETPVQESQPDERPETSVQESQHDETVSCKDAEDLEYEISISECKTKDVALPLNCSICEKSSSDPVVTSCQHYFCKNCALKHHKKNSTVEINEPTLDFNTAVENKERIAKEHMVKEVSSMIDKVSTMADNALDVAGKVVKIVEEVEKLVYKASSMSTEAGETAVKAVKRVQEARDTTEMADPNKAKTVEEVEEVETLVKAVSMAMEAGEMAVKSAEMVHDAWATMEIAKVNLTEAFGVTKTMMWR